MKTIEVLEKPPGFNKCINGGFSFWQYGTTFTGVGGAVFVADRWFNSDNLTTGVFDVSQQTDIPTNATDYSLRYDVTTAESIANNGYLFLSQKFEGNIIKPLYGKSIAVSFWVKSNKIGTYCVNLRNDALNRSYITEYTIDTADTWEEKIVVINHDLIGSWATDNSAGAHLNFILESGSDYYGAANTWHSSNLIATSNQTNFADSTANYIQFAEIMVYEGRGLTDGFVLHGGNRNNEELSCFKYYIDNNSLHNTAEYFNATNLIGNNSFPVTMRTTPTIILYYSSNLNVVRSLHSGVLISSTVNTFLSKYGFGSIIATSGSYTSTHRYHFGYIADAEL